MDVDPQPNAAREDAIGLARIERLCFFSEAELPILEEHIERCRLRLNTCSSETIQECISQGQDNFEPSGVWMLWLELVTR